MAATRARGRGTLLYDGDCGFCTSAARLAGRIAPDATVVPWQRADLARFGLTAEDATAALQFVDADHRGAGADAVGLFLVGAGSVYRVFGHLLLLPVVRPVARVVYTWVARHRHRLPGGTPACAMKAGTSGRR